MLMMPLVGLACKVIFPPLFALPGPTAAPLNAVTWLDVLREPVVILPPAVTLISPPTPEFPLLSATEDAFNEPVVMLPLGASSVMAPPFPIGKGVVAWVPELRFPVVRLPLVAVSLIVPPLPKPAETRSVTIFPTVTLTPEIVTFLPTALMV